MTQEELAVFLNDIGDLRTNISALDRDDTEQISDALTQGEANLAGSGTDTSDGNKFILILLGDKV